MYATQWRRPYRNMPVIYLIRTAMAAVLSQLPYNSHMIGLRMQTNLISLGFRILSLVPTVGKPSHLCIFLLKLKYGFLMEIFLEDTSYQVHHEKVFAPYTQISGKWLSAEHTVVDVTYCTVRAWYVCRWNVEPRSVDQNFILYSLFFFNFISSVSLNFFKLPRYIVSR